MPVPAAAGQRQYQPLRNHGVAAERPLQALDQPGQIGARTDLVGVDDPHQATRTGMFSALIFWPHSRGPVSCTDAPRASTATVTGMSSTSNS